MKPGEIALAVEKVEKADRAVPPKRFRVGYFIREGKGDNICFLGESKSRYLVENK